MLRFDQIAAVRRLLAARHSLRAVHRLTGVSRGSIARIAAGRREPAGDAAAFDPPACGEHDRGPALGCAQVRCGTCGHRVVRPCRVCAARAWRRATLASARFDAADEPCGVVLGLELRGETLARYEALRRERLRREGHSAAPRQDSRRAS